jgi:hypothetical protein
MKHLLVVFSHRSARPTDKLGAVLTSHIRWRQYKRRYPGVHFHHGHRLTIIARAWPWQQQASLLLLMRDAAYLHDDI